MNSSDDRGDGELSVLIVNYNGGRMVEACLRSIYSHPPVTPFEVVVVDNASIDGSADNVARMFPQVRLIRNPSNLGLTGAMNIAKNAARGQFLFMLNDDATLLPGALDALVVYLRAHPDVAIAASRLYNPDMTLQRTARRFPSPVNALFGRRSLLTKLLPNNRFAREYMMSEQEWSNEPYDVDWVSGAAMMSRREAVEEIGGLDEEFFVYWCDADWCHRFKRAGWRIVCVPQSEVVHAENLQVGRLLKRRAKMIIDFHRGAWLYFRKNQLRYRYGPLGLLTLIGLTTRAAALIAFDEWRLFKSRFERRNGTGALPPNGQGKV